MSPEQPVDFAIDFSLLKRDRESYRTKVDDWYRFEVRNGEIVDNGGWDEDAERK